MELPKQYSDGLTLLELLIGLAIATILLTIAIPSFNDMLNRNHVASSVNGFISSLHFARSEAVSREMWVTLCPSRDGASCVPDYTSWNKGYIVFVNKDKDRDRDAGESILAVYQDVSDQVTVQTSSDHRNVITYRPSGRAWGYNTTVRFCLPESSSHNRTIIIATTGRLRLSDQMPGGKAITCE